VRIAIGALAIAACGAPTRSAPPRVSNAAVATPPSASTAIPALGLRIGCVGSVQAMGDVATITCGPATVSIGRFAPAQTLDDAIAELRASATSYLGSTTTRELRSAHAYRHEHHNHGASGENYWSDNALEIDGRYYLCVAAPSPTPDAATRAGELCATVTQAP
jgi:hypothetical protein